MALNPLESWIRQHRPHLVAEVSACSREFTRDCTHDGLLMAVAKQRSRAVRVAIVEALNATVLDKERQKIAEMSRNLKG